MGFPTKNDHFGFSFGGTTILKGNPGDDIQNLRDSLQESVAFFQRNFFSSENPEKPFLDLLEVGGRQPLKRYNF